MSSDLIERLQTIADSIPDANDCLMIEEAIERLTARKVVGPSREAIARTIYAVAPIRVTNRLEPLTFDEVLAQGRWIEPGRCYSLADAIIALLETKAVEGNSAHTVSAKEGRKP